MLSLAIYAEITLLLYWFWLLLVAVHEAGHLAAGLFCGFTAELVRVGPVALTRSASGKRAWTWDGRPRALCSGEVRMRPGGGDLSRILPRYTLYILGGPIANLLAPVILFPLALTRGGLADICQFFIVGSVGMALINMVPSRTTLGRSDGGRVLDIVFRPDRREDLLFRFCLRARLLEIIRLAREHQHREALAILDAQLGLSERLLVDERSVGFRNWMRALRPQLEHALAHCEHGAELPPMPEPAPNISAVEPA